MLERTASHLGHKQPDRVGLDMITRHDKPHRRLFMSVRPYGDAAGVAYARALDLARRAERLCALARSVRTKRGAAGLRALLADDAIAASGLGGLGSERAARRFLERLVALGALRELTGRPAFRLYGL
jgi:hypothetical protein